MKKHFTSFALVAMALTSPAFANNNAAAPAATQQQAAPVAAQQAAAPTAQQQQTAPAAAPQAAKPTTAASTNPAAKPTAAAQNQIKQNDTVVLQAGAFSNPDLAYKQAARVSLSGVPAKVVRMQNKKGETVRVVRSSQTFKASDAEKIATDLRKDNINVMLMKQ